MQHWFSKGCAIAFLLLGLFVLALSHPHQTAYACTPPVGGLPQYTLSEHVQMAPIVLEGNVIAVDQTSFPTTATIEVMQYFKGGGGPATLTVSRFGSSSVCLSMVYEGDHIILFASGDPHSGQLTAFYASQFDAVTAATPEAVQTVIDTVGQAPILPDVQASVTPEPEESASGGTIDRDRILSFGPLELCLGLLLAPLLLGSVLVVSHASRK